MSAQGMRVHFNISSSQYFTTAMKLCPFFVYINVKMTKNFISYVDLYDLNAP
jgi:hypothetical protein